MTASVLKQDPNTQKVKNKTKNSLVIRTKQNANFRGNPLYQAIKRLLNKLTTKQMKKNDGKRDGKLSHLSVLC